MIKENKREPLKVLLLMPSINLRTLKLKTKKLLLNKLSDKLKKERKPPLLKSKDKEKMLIKTKMFNKKLKIKLPKKSKRKLKLKPQNEVDFI